MTPGQNEREWALPGAGPRFMPLSGPDDAARGGFFASPPAERPGNREWDERWHMVRAGHAQRTQQVRAWPQIESRGRRRPMKKGIEGGVGEAKSPLAT